MFSKGKITIDTKIKAANPQIEINFIKYSKPFPAFDWKSSINSILLLNKKFLKKFWYNKPY